MAAVAASIVVAYYLFSFVDVWLASTGEFEAGRVVDGEVAAVVLGAAQYNGEPSPVLRARLEEAAGLYHAGEADLVVVTGGGQEADVTTEAKSGYDYLRISAGIPDERLRLEVQGGSTYESLAATSRFLRAEGVTEVVLVTDRYHAKRSSLIADEVGLDSRVALTPAPAPFDRLVREAGAVAVGRIIGFRRLERL
ncbi:MAG: YdcF family protein [Acidimicrobiales bacterium]